MDIISAKYTENGDIMVTTDTGDLYVPNNGGNRHRVRITDWVAEGGSIDPYVAPPAYATADEAKVAMVTWIDEFTEGVTGAVPKDEKLSWDAKEAAAKAVIAGNATAEQQSLLDDEAALTSETTANLANVIVTKAALYRQVVSRVAGLRRVLTAQIEAEADPYNYDAILQAGQVQAQQLADSLGL